MLAGRVPELDTMRIGILACDAIKDEIEEIVKWDQDVICYREYVDFGYHLNPDEMKTVLTKKIDDLVGKVDLIFLGYAHCQSLKGLPDMMRVPTVMLEYDDCIAALMTPDRYSSEKRCGEITWFYPSGWAKYGPEGLTKLFHLDTVKEYPPEFFLSLMFDGFKRCLFVDTGIGDIPTCHGHSCQLARTLGLKHESTSGSVELIRDAWTRAKEVAASLSKESHGVS